jgi:hypothetical protein
MSRVDRMLESLAGDLEKLHDAEARRFLRTFDGARREMAENLGELVKSGAAEKYPYTAQYQRTMLAQVESGSTVLRRRLGSQLSDAAERQKGAALDDLLGTIRQFEPDFVDAAGQVQVEALRRMTESQGLLLHNYSIQRYGATVVAEMQRALTVGLAMGATPRQLVERLAGPDGVIAGMRRRAELIVRMELNSAFNRYHLDAIKGSAAVLDRGLAADDPDRMMKKADEFTDLRNHAISRVLHGQVQDVDEPFRAPRAKVAAEHEAIQAARVAARLKRRRLSGILWPLTGEFYEGMNYPAHFWERGRIVPWRASWGGVGETHRAPGPPKPVEVRPKAPARPKRTPAAPMMPRAPSPAALAPMVARAVHPRATTRFLKAGGDKKLGILEQRSGLPAGTLDLPTRGLQKLLVGRRTAIQRSARPLTNREATKIAGELSKLYKAYPELRGVRFAMARCSLRSGAAGYYDAQHHLIVFDRHLFESGDFKAFKFLRDQALPHECAHALDAIWRTSGVIQAPGDKPLARALLGVKAGDREWLKGRPWISPSATIKGRRRKSWDGSAWFSDGKSRAFVSDYAVTNPAEDMAECFRVTWKTQAGDGKPGKAATAYFKARRADK